MTNKKSEQSKIYEEFYTIQDVKEMLNCSERSAQKLFNDPHFPACDYFKQKVVHRDALIEYFSKRHEKGTNNYWKK